MSDKIQFLFVVILALPALYNDTTSIAHDENILLELDWADWDQNVDYGNGPVSFYRVYCIVTGNGQLSACEETSDSTWIPQTLLPDTQYDFAVSVLRSVDGNDTEGKLRNVVSGTTHCLGK